MGHYDTCMEDRCSICSGGRHTEFGSRSEGCPFAPEPKHAPAIKSRRGGSTGRKTKMSCGMTDRRGQDDVAEQQVKRGKEIVAEIQSAANAKQVGGKHYQKGAVQHWDFIADNGIGYLEGCASKYLARHLDKNGLQDLEKARHYVEKIIEKATTKGYQNKSKAMPAKVLDWCNSISLGKVETFAIYAIFTWGRDIGNLNAPPPQLRIAIELIDQLIKETKSVQAEVARRSMYGAKHEPRGFDPAQDVAPRLLCATVGGEDRPARVGDQVIVKSHLPHINGRSAHVVEIDGVWVKVCFDSKMDNAGVMFTCQYVDLTIIEKA